ncbi:hypothetical protein, partial [Nonomuraea glycinis]
MMKIKNTLTAGAMVLSAFVAPITMPASAASAEPLAQRTSSTETLNQPLHPCKFHKKPAKCRARGHGGGGGGGGGGDINITNNNNAGGGGGGGGGG